MAPILRPTDPRPGAPGPAAPGGMAPAPPPGQGPGQMAPGPSPGMGPGQMAPPIDPAEMQRQAMIGLLEQAAPVPGTVRHLPDAIDTMPKPYFPANAERPGRRSGGY